MADLLIRDIDPEMQRLIEERAQRHARDLSAEAKALIEKGLETQEPLTRDFKTQEPITKMGTWMASLVPPEFKGDDLDFEVRGPPYDPPDFE